MKIIVKPKYERSRWFRDLVRAMQFAETARERQAGKPDAVTVNIFDGYSPNVLATYGRSGSSSPTSYVWRWGYAQR